MPCTWFQPNEVPMQAPMKGPGAGLLGGSEDHSMAGGVEERQAAGAAAESSQGDWAAWRSVPADAQVLLDFHRFASAVNLDASWRPSMCRLLLASTAPVLPVCCSLCERAKQANGDVHRGWCNICRGRRGGALGGCLRRRRREGPSHRARRAGTTSWGSRVETLEPPVSANVRACPRRPSRVSPGDESLQLHVLASAAVLNRCRRVAARDAVALMNTEKNDFIGQ